MTTTNPTPKLPAFTREYVEYSMGLLKGWFPEESDNIESNHEEIVNHVLNQTQPLLGSTLLKIQYAKSPTSAFTENLAVAPLSQCEEAWFGVMIDLALLGFSLAGLKANVPDKVALSRKLDKAAVNGLDVVLNKLSSASTAWKLARARGNDGLLGAAEDLAKAIFGLIDGLYHLDLFHVIWDDIKEHMSWWDWIKDGLTAICAFLIWFGTAGVAFIAECISFVMSAISTIDDIVTAEETCPISKFIADLSVGALVPPNGVLAHVNEPTLCEFNGLMYLFHKNSGVGIECITSTDGNNWSLPMVIGANNCVSAPSSVVYKDTLYVFYQGLEDPALIWYTTTADGKNWTAPQHLDTTISTSSSPTVVVFNDKLYVFYMGSGGDVKIWYVGFDGTSWDALEHIHDGVATSTTPNAAVLDNTLYIFYKGSDSDTNIWMVSSADGNVWGAEVCCETDINTDTTPAAYLTSGECTLYYRGSGSNHFIWKATGTDVASMMKAACTSSGIATVDAPVVASLPSGAAVYYSTVPRSYQNKPVGKLGS